MSKKTGHYCSFCGKDQKDVERLSKGESLTRAPARVKPLPLRANAVC